mgnify:CR=1 FL=1
MARHTRFAEILSLDQEKIIWILFANSIILWLLTIATTHIFDFPPDTLSYTKQLSVFYWIGMVLNCVLFVALVLGKPIQASKKVELNHSVFVIILILYIFGTPLFIYTNPRIIDVYGYTSYAIDTVITMGYASSPIWQWQHEYINEFPGTTVFSSMIIRVLGITTISFAKYYPLYLMFILSFLIYAISKKVAGNYALFAPVAYCSLTFVSEYNLAPQSHALMLTTTFLLILIPLLKFKKQDRNILIKKSVLIVLWIIIVTTHPSTPIINLLCFFVVFTICIGFEQISSSTNRYFNLPRNKLIKIGRVYRNFLLLFGVMYVAYIIYVSNFMLNNIVSMSQQIMNDALTGNMFGVTAPLATHPSASYMLLYYVRWIEIIGILVLGLSSIFVLFFKSKDKTSAFIVGTLFMGYMSFSAVLVIAGETASTYGPGRGMIFGLVPCSIIFSMVLNAKLEGRKYQIFKMILLLFIISSLLALPLARYGSDPYNFVSESEFAGMQFVSQHPQLEITIQDFCNPAMHSSPFTNYWYNLFELKQQRGDEYANSFIDQHKLYDSGQCKIYQNRCNRK